MNERFKTLCKEAFTEAHESRIGPDGLIRSDGNPYIFYEKLAKLIVRECVEVVKCTPSMFPNDTVIKNIKEHFGVEE
jgi:hypothetical protein